MWVMNLKVLVARRQRAMTQAELADKVGCQREDIGKIETHGWVPPTDIQEKIAAVLRVERTDIFGPGSEMSA